MDLSPDGRYLVVADHGKAECVVIDLEKPPAKVVLRDDPMADYVAISPDGHWAASSSWQTTMVKIWDARSGELVKTLNMPGRARVTFSPDGRWLATSTMVYQLWETASWRPKGPPMQGESIPEENSLTFNSDGRLMAITHDRNKVRLLETMSGTVLATLESPDSFHLSNLRFSPDDTHLAATRIDGQLEIWDLRMIRQELAEMHLDWDQPPFPPLPKGEKPKPLSVRMDPRIGPGR
jgi:WD40 repeat protein